MGKGGNKTWAGAKVGEAVKITKAEMAKHNTVNDAWMSIGNKVYDVSGWQDHPGGSVIFTHAGDDMTDVFTMFHPPNASDVLTKFYVGELVEDKAATQRLTPEEQQKKEEQAKFEQAYRSLRGKMKAAGLFKVNYWYYAYKFASQIALVAVAAWFATIPNIVGFLFGAVFLALFWQQAGWLAHDCCHNQLAQKNDQPFSVYNKILGLTFGNLCQGFSVKWWKDKHNRHHAVPNVHGSGASLNGDPDIDTMPLLAWSLKMAELGKDNPSNRFMISVQKYTYLPLLAIARLSWLQQGIQFAWNIKEDGIFANATKSEDLRSCQEAALQGVDKYLEQSLLIIHHLWVAALCSQRPTALNAFAFWFTAQAICGYLLFAVTSLGHNGLVVYEASDRPDYWKLQVTTTRNISGNWFVHWLCGGLEYQVDHHLFPTMPRHSLPAAHELIVSFCKEHGIKYNEASLYQGTLDVLAHLDEVAGEFITEFPAM